MKILWMVNQLPRDYSTSLSITLEYAGGWIESMIDQIKKYNECSLTVVCKVEDKKEYPDRMIDGVYYTVVRYNDALSLEDQCRKILDSMKPELVQIDGTEFPHASAMFNMAKEMNIPILVSLQGVLNGLYPYECGELPIDEWMLSFSPKKVYSAWMLYLRKMYWFRPRMKKEKEILLKAEYITGRTIWDRAHSYAMNPKAKYYSCSRVLRDPFYKKTWKLPDIEKYSIYVGNGYSALKGLHFVLEAMPLLIREYPDVHLYVSGPKPYEKHDKRPLTKRGYASYIKNLVKQYNLESYVTFIGPMQANEVAEMLTKAHVYILSSTIENSPNTLGEAMLVGTPCVSAYAGGAPEMAVDQKEALFYRSNDPALLAWNVKRIFDDDELAISLSRNAKAHAKVTHDPELNGKQLVNIYKNIIDVSLTH